MRGRSSQVESSTALLKNVLGQQTGQSQQPTFNQRIEKIGYQHLPIPQEFECMILRELMDEPTMIEGCDPRHYFERRAIERCIHANSNESDFGIHPITKKKFYKNQLIPQEMITQQIESYLTKLELIPMLSKLIQKSQKKLDRFTYESYKQSCWVGHEEDECVSLFKSEKQTLSNTLSAPAVHLFAVLTDLIIHWKLSESNKCDKETAINFFEEHLSKLRKIDNKEMLFFTDKIEQIPHSEALIKHWQDEIAALTEPTFNNSSIKDDLNPHQLAELFKMQRVELQNNLNRAVLQLYEKLDALILDLKQFFDFSRYEKDVVSTYETKLNALCKEFPELLLGVTLNQPERLQPLQKIERMPQDPPLDSFPAVRLFKSVVSLFLGQGAKAEVAESRQNVRR